MPETKMEQFKRIAHRSREGYIEDLTDVAWLALKDAGLVIEHNGSDYDRLRDVIAGAL